MSPSVCIITRFFSNYDWSICKMILKLSLINSFDVDHLTGEIIYKITHPCLDLLISTLLWICEYMSDFLYLSFHYQLLSENLLNLYFSKFIIIIIIIIIHPWFILHLDFFCVYTYYKIWHKISKQYLRKEIHNLYLNFQLKLFKLIF